MKLKLGTLTAVAAALLLAASASYATDTAVSQLSATVTGEGTITGIGNIGFGDLNQETFADTGATHTTNDVKIF